MATVCKALALFLLIGPRPARRWAAGPPVQPARPPCASESLTSRPQRRARPRAQRCAQKGRLRHSKIESALAARERSCYPPNSPRHTFYPHRASEKAATREARDARCSVHLSSRPARGQRVQRAPVVRRGVSKPSPVSPRVFRALRGARVVAHVLSGFAARAPPRSSFVASRTQSPRAAAPRRL